MGIFRRRPPTAQPVDRIEWVTATARAHLAERGVETTIEHGADLDDVVLVGADRMRFPLYNAFAKTRDLPAAEAARVIAAHLDGVLVGNAEPSPSELTADELRERVRTRVLIDVPSAPDAPTFDYARPFSDGLVLALCIDFPQSVAFVTDENVTRLALGIDELYAFGQLNTDREPIDERVEPAPGLHVIAGDSMFVASKAANLPAAFGAAPYGTLFTVPHRHLLIALPVTGPATLTAVEQLVAITAQVLEGAPAPGGVLSADVHFSRDGVVSRVSRRGEGGQVQFIVDERLGAALEQAAGGEAARPE